MNITNEYEVRVTEQESLYKNTTPNGDFTQPNLSDLIQLIEVWGAEKGLLDNNKKLTQLAKLFEEGGELASGILKDDKVLQKDSIGDCVVVLTLLARQLGFTLEECIREAYIEIKDRTGTISKDGSFIKD
jgi:NTP pyrophosphatase (non-canonical NTP hydrolase)